MRTGRRDALTKLHGRESLLEELSRLTDRALLAVVDLDDLRTFNVRFGLRAGDERLRQVARDLAMWVTPSELFRIGDDEFAFLIQPPPSDPARYTSALVSAWSQGETFSALRLGWVVVDPAETDPALGRAAAAVAAAKTSPTRTAGFTEHDAAAIRRRQAISRALAGALQPGQHQLQLVYQPISRLDTGELVAVEALARWQHPTLGVIAPDEFVVLAEQTGQSCDLDRWVLQRALTEAPELESAPMLHINLSAASLTTVGFTDVVLNLIGSSDFEPSRICLELTETALATNSLRLRHAVETLHATGIRISIDDFGTGHASWSYLNELPVDELKLDKTYVERIDVDTQRAAVVRAVIAVAEACGQTLVAEGVETADQARALLALGCSLGQGYLLGRPLAHLGAHPTPSSSSLPVLELRPRSEAVVLAAEHDVAQRITDLARELSATSGEPGPVLHTTLALLRRGMDFEGGSLQLVGDDGVRLAAAEPAPPPEAMAARLPVGQGVAGTVLTTGRLVYLPDITSSPAVPTRRRAISGGVRSYLAVPMFRDGKAIGVLQIDSHHVDAFDADARLTLSAAAALVAAALVQPVTAPVQIPSARTKS